MNPKEIIKQLCVDYESSQKEIADGIGMKCSNFSRSLDGDMKLSTFVKMVKEIGAKVVVQTDMDNYIIDV